MRRYQQTYTPISGNGGGGGTEWNTRPYISYNHFLRKEKDMSYINTLTSNTTTNYDREFNYFTVYCQDASLLHYERNYTNYIDTKLTISKQLGNNSGGYVSNWGQSVLKTTPSYPDNTIFWEGYYYGIPNLTYNVNKDPITQEQYDITQAAESEIQVFYCFVVFDDGDLTTGMSMQYMRDYINPKLDQIYGRSSQVQQPAQEQQEVIITGITNRNLHGWYGTIGPSNGGGGGGGTGGFLDGHIKEIQKTYSMVPGSSNRYVYESVSVDSSRYDNLNLQPFLRKGTLPITARENYNNKTYTDLINGDVAFLCFQEMPWNGRYTIVTGLNTDYTCYLLTLGVVIPAGKGLPKIDI